MPFNTNAWNRFRYTLILPLYAQVVKGFERDRQRAIELLQLQPGEKVLILGCGPGLDLKYMTKDLQISAIDITPLMVAQTKQLATQLGLKIDAQVMDGQKLDFPAEHFDAVVLNLILAVIPDPYACIAEAVRVLKPGGRAIIFDKFLPDDEAPSLGRKILNIFTDAAFSNINRQLAPILKNVPVMIEHREAGRALRRLGYQMALVRKNS